MSVAGPLARSPEDLEIAMKVLAAPQSQDSVAWSIKLPKPKINDVKKLKVAVWPEEESAEIDEQIRSLIDETAEDLRSAGAQVEGSPPLRLIKLTIFTANLSIQSCQQELIKKHLPP